MVNRERGLRTLAGKVATREILDLMVETEKVHYRDLIAFAAVSSINQRLPELEKFGLVQHHITWEEKREEWYTITEAGKAFRKLLHEIDNLEQERTISNG